MDDLVERVARACMEPDSEGVPHGYGDYWMDVARAALSAIEAAGWRVVPVEPTPAMVEAGWLAGDDECEKYGYESVPHPGPIYQAMLKAAPKPTP